MRSSFYDNTTLKNATSVLEAIMQETLKKMYNKITFNAKALLSDFSSLNLYNIQKNNIVEVKKEN